MTRIKFGVKVNPDWYSFQTLTEICQAAEGLGYDTLWLADHLQPGQGDCLEAWTTIAALTGLTRRLKIGTLATSVSFRNPALLAKMVASLDVISGGRVVLGIGAGWMEEEYVAYGYDFPDSSTRVRQLKEALQVIDGLWTQDRATFNGRYYSIKNAVCMPKPVQKPRPKILVGITRGRKTLPYLAARYADGFNIGLRFPGGIPSLRFEDCKAIVESTRKHCERYHRDWNHMTRSYQLPVLIGKNAVEVDRLVESASKKRRELTGTNRKSALERGFFVGEPQECVQQIQPFIDIGMNDFPVIFYGYENPVQAMRTFRDDVISHLR